MVNLSVWYLIYFLNISQFSEYNFFTSLVKFVPRYLILFDEILNEIGFFLFLKIFIVIQLQLFAFSPHKNMERFTNLRILLAQGPC